MSECSWQGEFLSCALINNLLCPSSFSSLGPSRLLPAHFPTKPLLPSIPGQESAARPGSSSGRQGWYLSHSKWNECWAAGGTPASAVLGWWIVGSCARNWWGQPVLLGVKAVTRSPSKASFTCPCHSSNILGLTLSKAHCAGNSLKMVSCTRGPEMLVLLLATTELSECAATSLPPLLGVGGTPPRKQLYGVVSQPGMPEYWLGSCSLKPTPFSKAEPPPQHTPLLPARPAAGPVTWTAAQGPGLGRTPPWFPALWLPS